MHTHFLLIWITLLLFGLSSLTAQSTLDYDQILEELKIELDAGNQRALRDVGTLLDHPIVGQKAALILKDQTLFQTDEIDFSEGIDKDAFLAFYYANHKEIKYSDLLKAFYRIPVEAQSSWFALEKMNAESQTDKSLQLRRFIIHLEDVTSKNDDKMIQQEIEHIIDLNLAEGYKFLINYLKTKALQNKKSKNCKEICLQIAEGLTHYPTDESLAIVLKALQKELLTTDAAAPILAKITNLVPTTHTTDIAAQYKIWQDSLGSVEKMQAYGYQRVISFSPTFFEFPVDYYGRILSIADAYPWIRHNALRDIVKTEHPRALFYIAAQVYQYRNDSEMITSDFVKQIEQLTELRIKIVSETGKTAKPNWTTDVLAKRYYMSYWAAHYDDYEWDEIRCSFINKTEKLELTENYERLFRRLNSENDSVAMQAWLLLSEGDPVDVVGLANKYKELLRNYNKNLPAFKYRYLEQLVQLTDFCRRNKVHYRPTSKLQHWLSLLSKEKDEKKRYQLENRIIRTLTLDEVTSIEYWGILNENNRENTFSAGRILDWFYSENWWRVTQNEEQLRLYLKKSALLQNIGVIGVCNHYTNKFGVLYPDLEKRLRDLLSVEADAHIISQINYLLTNNQETDDQVLVTFFEDPTSIKHNEIRNLPAPTTKDLIVLSSALLQTEGNELKALLKYVSQFPQEALVPDLFALLGRGEQEKKIMQLLAKIFNHSFKKAADWFLLWEESNSDYKGWKRQFFDEKVALLKSDEPLDSETLNAITSSEFYEEKKHKKLVISNLNRLKPIKQIRRFRISPKLNLADDLIYFADLDLGEKELDNIPRLFEMDSIQQMIDFLVLKSEHFDVDARGSFFNNLFRANWFTNYINDGRLPQEQALLIQNALDTYLNESVLISEFEEQATIRNIALINIARMPLQAKLETSLQLAAEGGQEAVIKIQEAILARISYEEIGEVARYFPDLTTLSRYNFLNKDFGLPIFNLTDLEVQETVLAMHEKYKTDPKAFYAHYLDEFKVDYRDEKGELDYNKIYRILKYDIVTPFVGDGGTKRDYFTYGIIKLLEWDFNTRLGFHPKLNENQNFYSFSASIRAEAWLTFLEEKGLVKPSPEASPSFNQTSINTLDKEQ